MKLRNLILSGMALFSVSVFAQTHTQGIEYYKAEQYTNALELLNRNLNNPGTDKSLSNYYLGMIEMRRNKIADATNYFNAGVSANPEDPYNYIGLGYIALKSGDLKTAEKYFKDAEKRAKKDYSVNVDIARAYYTVDPVAYKEKYEKIIETALKKDSENPDIYIFQGDVLRDEAYDTENAKTYGQAAAKYDMATSKDPESAVAYVKYADMYMNAKNPNYAIKKLEELVANNPSSALGQRQLAQAYYDNQKFDKAAEQYGKYVQNPNHFKEDENNYALLLYFDSNYQKGYDYATQLLNANPNDFTARRFQFMNAFYLDSMKDQLPQMAQTILAEHNKDPKNLFAPIDYTLLSNALEPADAVSVLEEAIELMPDNTNFYKTLSNVYLKSNDYKNAADAYINFVDKSQNPEYVDMIRATIYAYNAAISDPANTQYFDIASTYADKAKGMDDTQYQPYKLKGDIAMTRATGKEAGVAAVNDYLQAAQRIEANPNPQFNNDAKTIYKYLGAAYIDKNDKANAKKYLGKYLEIEPNDAAILKIYNGL